LTLVSSVRPRTGGLAAIGPYSRSDFLGAGSAAWLRNLARGRRAGASDEAAADGGNAREVVPAHHLVQGGRLGGHVLRRCGGLLEDRKSTRLNSSHVAISYAV